MLNFTIWTYKEIVSKSISMEKEKIHWQNEIIGGHERGDQVYQFIMDAMTIIKSTPMYIHALAEKLAYLKGLQAGVQRQSIYDRYPDSPAIIWPDRIGKTLNFLTHTTTQEKDELEIRKKSIVYITEEKLLLSAVFVDRNKRQFKDGICSFDRTAANYRLNKSRPNTFGALIEIADFITANFGTLQSRPVTEVKRII